VKCISSPPRRFETPALTHAQELGWKLERQIADLA